MGTIVTDDLAMTMNIRGWLYRFETAGDIWKRTPFFTMPIARHLCKSPTRLFIGESAWAFSSCRYQNGALTDTFYLLRSPTSLEMWDPWLVRSSGEWLKGKLPTNVGLPVGFQVEQIAAAGPFLAIFGTVLGRTLVAYRPYNADLVGLHPLLNYTGLVNWEPGVFLSCIKRSLVVAGFNMPPIDPVVLQGSDCWKFFALSAGANWNVHLRAPELLVEGAYEISYNQSKLTMRRLDALVVPSTLPVIDTTAESDYDWIGQSEFPQTHFDQCVYVRDGKPVFCRQSILDFLRAGGDGTLVDARGSHV